MNLMHLIKRYSYLKIFVDVYEEYIKEHGDPEVNLIQEIEQKYHPKNVCDISFYRLLFSGKDVVKG